MGIAEKLACFVANVVTALIMIVATSLYFTGVPLLRDIPLIGHVPLIGWIAEGEIARRTNLALEGYVTLSEKTAVQAQLDRERELRTAADEAVAALQKRASEAQKAKEAADEKIKRLEAEDSGDDGAVWGPDDIDWLSKH
jgi:hypothetical protein